MSVTTHVVARKRLSPSELDLIAAYNTLVNRAIRIPQEMQDQLIQILGEPPKYGWDERIQLDQIYVELYVEGEGRIEYDNGMILELGTLPTGTTALRIYMS